MSFDFTTSGCNAGVNSNLYTISPAKGVATSGYCDIQSNDSPQVTCFYTCTELMYDVWRVAYFYSLFTRVRWLTTVAFKISHARPQFLSRSYACNLSVL